jgi:hypothetical protein
MGGGFDGGEGRIYVTLTGAGERGDFAIANIFRYGADAVEVAGRGDRESGFDDVNAEGLELMRHAEFFGDGHGKAGRLFAVAESSVEDLNALHG